MVEVRGTRGSNSPTTEQLLAALQVSYRTLLTKKNHNDASFLVLVHLSRLQLRYRRQRTSGVVDGVGDWLSSFASPITSRVQLLKPFSVALIMPVLL